MTSQMTLGEKIRFLRERKNLKQKELAIELGVAQQTLSHYEKGRIEPDYGILLNLAEIFDVSVDYLLGRNDDPFAIKAVKAVSFDDKLIDISALSPEMQQLVRKMVEEVQQAKRQK